MVGLGFLGLTLAICCSIDFVSLTAYREIFRASSEENVKLKEHLGGLEKRYATKMSDLVRIHSMASKLKVITRVATSDREQQVAQVAPTLPASDTGEGEVDVVERGPTAIGGPRIPAPDTERMIMPRGELASRIDQARQYSQEEEQELIAIWESLTDRENLIAATPTIKPANGYFSSRFGYRVDPINHRSILHAGVDIAAPYGSLVHAPADGVVSHVGYESGYGNLVSIDHGFGITTRFAHNSRILVKQGQRVRRGDSISMVGSTGRSTGAHVHYEVRVHGFPVDPINYILQDN